MRGKARFFGGALLATAALGAMPASASVVTNTFYGVVLPDGTTDNDYMFYNFGGGSFIGKPFTLVMTMDTSLASQIDDPTTPTYVAGGPYYYGYGANPLNAQLTINGFTFDVDAYSEASSFWGYPASSDSESFDLGGGLAEQSLQVFNATSGCGYICLQPAVGVDISTLVPAVDSLAVPLPAMLESKGQYVTNFANFYFCYTTSYCQNINLDIQAVNETPPVPEPVTVALFGAGAIGAGMFRLRRSKKARVA